MTLSGTDRIEKKTLLRAPRARVWRALTTPVEFGEWFGVGLEKVTAFVPGHAVSGPVRIPQYDHLTWNVVVDEVVPERRFSFRWHPYAVDPKADYSSEPSTLVVFELEDADGGTLLTVVESGFDAIPLERRADAFRGNEGGWTVQLENIARYVSRTQ